MDKLEQRRLSNDYDRKELLNRVASDIYNRECHVSFGGTRPIWHLPTYQKRAKDFLDSLPPDDLANYDESLLNYHLY